MGGRGAARGRGGGRGGATRSFSREQLAALGAGSADNTPAPTVQPPPLFPDLRRQPKEFKRSAEMDYLLMLKQDFIDRMQLSPSYLQMPLDKNSAPGQQTSKLVARIPSVRDTFDWAMFPAELRPKLLAKKVVKASVVKNVDVMETLTKLESLEKVREVKEEAENDPIDEEELLEEELDEEMDDGTDYANNYFDNGEAYEEEDDNLDEVASY